MQPSDVNQGGLTREQQDQLEQWLRQFDEGWQDGLLTRRLRELPAAGPYRLAALVGMVKIELRHQYRQGRKPRLENYLRAYSELGTPDTVSIDLIQAEVQGRRQAGETVTPADLAKRFPRQTEQLRRGLDQVCRVPPPPPAATPAPAAPDPYAGTLIPLAAPAPPAPGGTVRGEGAYGGTVRPEPPKPPPEEVTRRAPEGPAERYHILKELGRGAMGTVYLAQDTHLQRQVALKVPHFRTGDSDELLQRFHREARSAATLDHPNICPVYDVGENSGIPYLTMAYIEGHPLGDLVRHGKPLAARDAATIVYKLARALEEAHRRGIIHRDLKPANVMMNRRAEPVIMDFGLARRLEGDVRLTHQGSVMGTPAYMSPEQIHGDLQTIGPPTDQYSLGVILYELITGQVPFQGNIGQVMAKVLTEKPRPPRELRPDLDEALSAICLRAMSHDIADRFPSVSEFAKALGDYLQLRPKSSPDLLPVHDGPRREFRQDTQSIHQSSYTSTFTSSRRRAWRRRVALLLVASAILLVLAAVGLLVWHLRTAPTVDSTVRIRINSEPPGATVFLNGKREGKETPAQFELSPGTHQLELELKGHEPFRKEIKVESREKQSFTYTLNKRGAGKGALPPAQGGPVAVTVRSDPPGATVFLAGRDSGKKTPAVLPLTPGTHELRVALPGYAAAVRKIEVTAGAKEQPLDLGKLTPLPRRLELRFTPANARMEIDGKEQQPGAIVALLPGPHRVRLKLAAHATLEKDIAVAAGEGPQVVPLGALQPLKRENYALLIGVHSPGKELPDFVHAEPDVVELGRLLVAGGYRPDRVTVLTQTLADQKKVPAPTAEEIRKRVGDLTARCTEEDSILVALVGHVVQFPGGEESLFCPAESVLATPASLLPLRDVYARLKTCKARSRLLVLDGWRREWLKDGPAARAVTRERAARLVPDSDVAVWVCCSAGERGYEHPDQRHGAFFEALLRELRKGSAVPLRQLAESVRKSVVEVTRADYPAAQTPEVLGGPDAAEAPPVRVSPALAAYARGCDHLEGARRAKVIEKAEELGRAVEAFKEATELDKDFAEAYTRRAAAYYYAGKYAEAVTDCKKVVEGLDPNDATAYSHWAEALGRLKDYDQAFMRHDQAIRLDPSYAQAHNERGQTYFKTKDYDSAINDFTEALRLNERLTHAYHNRAIAYLSMKKKDTARAIADETEALKVDKNYGQAYFGRGLGHLFEKAFPKAIADLSRAIDLGANVISALTYREQAYRAVGDNASADADKLRRDKLKPAQ